MTAKRGAFSVDQDRALDVLRLTWSETHDLGFADGAYWATRLDGTGDLLRGLTPDELAVAIRADWGARSAQ